MKRASKSPATTPCQKSFNKNLGDSSVLKLMTLPITFSPLLVFVPQAVWLGNHQQQRRQCYTNN